MTFEYLFSPISDIDRNFQFETKTDPSKGVCHVSSVIFAHVPEAACCNHLSASIASYTHSFPPDGELGRSGRFCLAEAKARKREA